VTKTISVVFLSVLVACTASMACAKDQDGMFAVKGVGVLNCKAFIEAAREGDRELAQYAGYITGYISAVNEVQPDTFDLLPWQHIDTVMLLMLQRCRRDPQINFGAAVSGMASYFDQYKLSDRAEKISVGAADSGVELYEPVVAQIEVALERWGYTTRDLDASLRHFQTDQKLTEEDTFGQRTLLKLLYGQEDN